MQTAEKQAPIPQREEASRAVKFTKPFKWSPRGWDMEKCKPGETHNLPAKIADAAISGEFGTEVPMEDTEVEVEVKETSTRRKGK